MLDTNILIYSIARTIGGAPDPRTDAAERLLAKGGRVTVQILNEFVDVANRKLRLSWDWIDGRLSEIEELCGPALPLTAQGQREAVRISARYGLRIYDAMILASAREAGCDTLYTEDLQHGQVIEGLRIENPFVGI
ncbi:MAG TPA: PIN domain-containing protein [Terracidiphilus sp.]|nr:PIN domain-containing protein [Terracidiphilus sp.]